ncbi:4178_t:CDS:2 [Cetraspora pellucida]|uniref:4178_t:CDS:1 n=1 Tax=Cetraspora pellucida TaxID=1433469 RepID=A0ACA9L3H1_9GLOM|nr:4178_t:CDS:2 [Cetraspora pellucida]
MERSMSLLEESGLERDQDVSLCEPSEEGVVAESNFLNSLDRLTVDTLRVLCEAEGLSNAGTKKDMAERLAAKTASKLKGKDLAVSNQLVNMLIMLMIGQEQRFMNQGENDRLGEERRYLMLERSLEKSLQVTLAKALDEMKQSLYVISNKVKEDKFWPEIKMDRPRDQVRELAYTQAYTFHVANKEGWDIAAALRDSVSEDPMEANLREKLIAARQSTKSKKRKTDYVTVVSSSGSQLTFSQPHLGPCTQNIQLFQKFSGETSNVLLYQFLMPQQQQMFSQWS